MVVIGSFLARLFAIFLGTTSYLCELCGVETHWATRTVGGPCTARGLFEGHVLWVVFQELLVLNKQDWPEKLGRSRASNRASGSIHGLVYANLLLRAVRRPCVVSSIQLNQAPLLLYEEEKTRDGW